MAGPEFFQIRMGQQFYESTMPRIATALERIANAFDVYNKKAADGQGQEALPVQVPARGKSDPPA